MTTSVKDFDKMRMRPWSPRAEHFMATMRIDGEDVQVPTKTFTDLTPFWQGGRHALIQGRTGYGKTHLQLTLIREFLNLGFKAIYRDDGGLEFAQLLPHISGEMICFVPEEMHFSIKGDWGDRLRIHRFRHEDRTSILKMFKRLYEAPKGSVLVVIFDVYVTDPELSARFWADFLRMLLHFVLQKAATEKQQWILAIDQINEIVQSHGHETTEEHRKVRSFLEHNIRNIRKHRITMVATSHRYKEIPPSCRTQFTYHFLKRCEGSDVYDFANKKLLKASSKLFWYILREITTMGPETVWIMDEDGNYDRSIFDPFPWDNSIVVRARGEVRSMRSLRKQFDVGDMMVALLAFQGASYGVMSEITGLDRSSCVRRLKRIYSVDDRIANELAHITESKPSLKRKTRKDKGVVRIPR